MNDTLNTRRFVLIKEDKYVKVYRCRWPAEPSELEQFPILSTVKQHDYVIYHAVLVEGVTKWRFYRKPGAPHAHATREGHALRIAERLATAGLVELRTLFQTKTAQLNAIKKAVKKASKLKKEVIEPKMLMEYFHHRRFMCVYANSIAQVYQCQELSTREEAAEDHPLAKFNVGDCFIYYSHLSPTRTFWRFYREESKDEVLKLPRINATGMAERLFDETDEELRYGFRKGPEAHIMHRNRTHVIYFSQKQSYYKPFEVIREDVWKVAGSYRTLKDAIRKAEKEDKYIRENTRR